MKIPAHRASAVLARERADLIAMALVNDESSTDQELADYFMSEFQLSREDAGFYVSQRNRALSEDWQFKLEVKR